MYRWTVLVAALLISSLVVVGCTNGGGIEPVAPNTGSDLTDQTPRDGASTPNTYLWGYWELYFDFENQTVEAVASRSTEFNANVVDFLNGDPLGLGFDILETPVTAEWVDVDINVALTHPLAGLTVYNGYDVMGVFVGDGTDTLNYQGLNVANVGTAGASPGPDQAMLDDPDSGDGGGPDGFTRWFNAAEFPTPGLFGYTQGVFATPLYAPTGKVNPYKLFADGLLSHDNAYEFVRDGLGAGDNVFSSGETNERNYYIRFPIPDPNVVYGYAVVASWKGELPTDHPANTMEAVAASVTVTPDVYYVDAGDNGGDLILDIALAGYGSQPSTIIIESSVLSANASFPAASVVTGGGPTHSTYHVEVDADAVGGTSGQDFWVIAEYTGMADYSNEFGVPETTGGAPLAAFFGFTLFVANEPYNQAPIIESGVDGDDTPFFLGTEQYSVTATDPDGDPLTYSWDVYDVSAATEVITDDPGNGDGTIDVDFAALGAANGEQFDIDCEVSDPSGETAVAATLTVTASLLTIGVVGTPNKPIAAGTPGEIAVDPASDRTAIGFQWNNWYVYTSDYSSSTPYALPTYRQFDFTSTFGFRSYHMGGTLNRGWGYLNWAGSASSSTYFIASYNGFFGMTNIQNSTEVWGPYHRSIFDNGYIMRGLAYGSYSTVFIGDTLWWDGSGSTGVVVANVRAVAAPIYTSGYRMYYLEALPPNDGIVELWTMTSTPTIGITFGSGTLNNPVDITVDSNDNVYVLDINGSGSPVIYCWDDTGLLFASSGALSATEIGGTVVRMDAAIFPNPDEVHVLHTSGVTVFAIQ